MCAFEKLCASAALLVGFGLIAAGPASAQNSPTPATIAPPPSGLVGVTVPFTALPRHGGIVVPVKFGNGQETNFLIDTGSSTTLITSEIAKKFGLKRLAPQFFPDASGLIHQFDVVHADAFHIGQISIGGDLIVSDSLIAGINQGLPKDKKLGGILGADILSSYAFLVNFEQQYCVFILKGNLSDAVVKWLGFAGGSASSVPLQSTSDDDGLMLVPAHLDQTNASLLLDSGTYHTILPESAVGSSLQAGAFLVNKDVVGFRDTSSFSVYTFGSLGIGSMAFAPFQCGVIKDRPGKQNAVLGMDFLSRCYLLIDYPARRLYLGHVHSNMAFPTEAARANGQKEIEGMTVSPTAEGIWTVTDVGAGNRFARAGLQTGDVLVQMNGRKTDNLSPDGLLAAFQRDKTITYLQILRDNQTLSLITTGNTARAR